MNVYEDEKNMSIEYDNDDDDDEVADVTAAVAYGAGKQQGKYWPHMKFLFTKHSQVAFLILKAVDECKCTSEVNAVNGNNPKGNSWNRLYDNFYAGDSPGRGLLAPHKDSFRKVENVTKLKKKITEMWTFIIKESKKPKSDVPQEMLLIGLRQAKEYDVTSAKEKSAMEKQKFVTEKLQKDMASYESSTGALPPGVKGMVGGGRREHSTNLHTLQPASYAYANASSDFNDNDDDDIIDLFSSVVTPKSSAPKKQKGKHKAKGGNVNSGPAVVWEKITNNLNNQLERLAGNAGGNVNVGSKKSKLKVLKEQLSDLKDSIAFCKDIPDLHDQYVEEMEEYKVTLKKIKEEQKKEMAMVDE
jgi:hypothetical protein